MTQASRQWTEIRADANGPRALLARQNCMVLGIAATLELHDSKEVLIAARNYASNQSPPCLGHARLRAELLQDLYFGFNFLVAECQFPLFPALQVSTLRSSCSFFRRPTAVQRQSPMGTAKKGQGNVAASTTEWTLRPAAGLAHSSLIYCHVYT